MSPKYLNYEGDLSKPYTQIHLVQKQKPHTKEYLNTQLSQDQSERLHRMQNLIEGFESLMGLELLATVAYAKEHCPDCTKEQIIDEIQNWTDRKRELMTEHMISVSYDRVVEFGL